MSHGEVTAYVCPRLRGLMKGKGKARGHRHDKRSNARTVGPTWHVPQEGPDFHSTCGSLRTVSPGKFIAKEITAGVRHRNARSK